MRSALVFVLLSACSLGPAPSIAPPPAADCRPTAEAMIGTWIHEHTTMEVRADGTLLVDGGERMIRWIAPSEATITAAALREQHVFALVGPTQLIDVDTDGHAATWTRVSLAPPSPERCFDVRASVVGEWSDGLTRESFERDGTYARGNEHGNWAMSDAGVLEIGLGLRVRRYHVAIAAPDRLVTVPETPLPDDPRGPSLIEVRVR